MAGVGKGDPNVVRLLFSPTTAMAADQGVTPSVFAAGAHELANGLNELVGGQLRGMFDGPTSERIRFNSPVCSSTPCRWPRPHVAYRYEADAHLERQTRRTVLARAGRGRGRSRLPT